LDIEGAEKAIFATNPEEWLDRIGLLIIEIHGPEILHVVSPCITKKQFQYEAVPLCLVLQAPALNFLEVQGRPVAARVLIKELQDMQRSVWSSLP
jgi:hypothetical protein